MVVPVARHQKTASRVAGSIEAVPAPCGLFGISAKPEGDDSEIASLHDSTNRSPMSSAWIPAGHETVIAPVPPTAEPEATNVGAAATYCPLSVLPASIPAAIHCAQVKLAFPVQRKRVDAPSV